MVVYGQFMAYLTDCCEFVLPVETTWLYIIITKVQFPQKGVGKE